MEASGLRYIPGGRKEQHETGPSFIVTANDVPPVNKAVGKHTQCGWCASVIGEEHEATCVTRERSVVARLNIEFVTCIPEHWDAEFFEFAQNGNKFCASNHLDELAESDACVCGSLTYVREADERDEQLLPWSYRWDRR